MAGDGDVFVAARPRAVVRGAPWNRTGDLIRVDPSVCRGFGKIARLAIGPRGMFPATLAFCEALVDAIAVGLIGNDEYPAVGGCRRPGHREYAGQKCRDAAHVAPSNEESPSFDKPKGLIMINHGRRR